MRFDGPTAHVCRQCNHVRSTWTYLDQGYCDSQNKWNDEHPEYNRSHIQPGWTPYFYMTGCSREGCPAMDGRYDEMELKPAPTVTEEEYYNALDRNDRRDQTQ